MVDERTFAVDDYTKPNAPVFRKPGLHRILGREYWLIDEDIDKASHTIRNNYPHIIGLQDVCVISAHQGNKLSNPFLQMIHSHRDHWITITTIDCPPNTVRVYDSMFRQMDQLSLYQIDQFIQWNNKVPLTFQFMEFQRQRNKADCGLFAVAAAFSLAIGNDPSKYTYDDFKLRKHLVECLKTSSVKQFPSYNGEVKKRQSVSVIVIWCSNCKNFYQKVLQCPKCQPVSWSKVNIAKVGLKTAG